MFGTELTFQVQQYQNVTRPTWETRRSSAVLSPPPHRQGAGCPTKAKDRWVRLQLLQRQQVAHRPMALLA
jgi:hypothetical protein